MQIIYSFLKGIALGSFVTFLGFFFDVTFSRRSYKKLLEKSEQLLNKAVPAIQFNDYWTNNIWIHRLFFIRT